MAKIRKRPSRTFMEYRFHTRESGEQHTFDNISLRSPLVKYHKGEESRIYLNIGFLSAQMQAVSGTKLVTELDRRGGNGIFYSSQPIESEAEMVRELKGKRGVFQASRRFFGPDQTLRDVLQFDDETGFSTIPITSNGQKDGKLIGIVMESNTWRDDPLDTRVSEFMTPFNENYPHAIEGATLAQCKEIMRNYSALHTPIPNLPVIDENGVLKSLIFKKDFEERHLYPNEVIDQHGRYICGAGVNTHDYRDRIPAVVDAGADYVCFDSSNAFRSFMRDAIVWTKQQYPELIVGAGNIITAGGFRYLAKAGADFIKVGMGGGSICITQEQTGVGRGQATAVRAVAKSRDRYYVDTGIYIPIVSDGGLVQDSHISVAFALGADHVQMGRYFARMEESPTEKVEHNGRIVKPYWGEGSNRARNWQRYARSSEYFTFEQGVDGYVPYIGPMDSILGKTISKIKQTMADTGSLSLEEFRRKAILERSSEHSIKEGKAHDIIMSDDLGVYKQLEWG